MQNCHVHVPRSSNAWMLSLACSLIGFISMAGVQAALPVIDEAVGAAKAWTVGDHLSVSSGLVSREWSWTGKGFVTSGLLDTRSNQEWVSEASGELADWKFPGLTEGDATLKSLSAKSSDDDGFTSRHLEVTAELEYPKTGVTLKYVIWAYPNIPGLRTQIWLKQKLGEGFVGSAQKNEHNLRIHVAEGKTHRLPSSDAEYRVAEDYDVTNLIGPKSIELKVEGMNQLRDYKVMASWWDTGAGARRVQSIQALSMDGESEVTVVKPLELPGWRDHKMPATVSFDIPATVRVGDTVRLKIKKERGVNATISELWVYEKGATSKQPSLVGDAKRFTQLQAMAPQGYFLAAYMNCGVNMNSKKVADQTSADRRVDFLPVHDGKMTGFGYYNDTQHRNTPQDHLSREEPVENSSVDWASILFVENTKGGIAWVKESQKCVNQSGVDTGGFSRDDTGLHNSGSGLSAEYLQSDSYRWCWASWTVLYPEATADQRELAMKQFDRARFPVDPQRDVWVKANTWGSGNSGTESMAMAAEVKVLKEIESVADLGIDVLQIDDGWQKGRSQESDAKEREWYPRDDWYPNGWKTVRKTAAAKSLRLGLWTAARVDLGDLKRNYDQGGFVTWKYDFASIKNYDNLYEHWAKLRAFLKYTGHKASMAVDVTENASRFGYFWARDFGCVWLSNRKPNNPDNTVPKPTLMLRESRELAEYVNLNKFELPIQNFSRADKEKSDASLYGHTYEVALGLMGIPTFFQTTYYYEGAARAEVREILKVYKAVQHDLFQRYVFAIGEIPNGSSMSGFQWVSPDSDTGYLLVFRERLNEQAKEELVLRFLKPGTNLQLTDLRSGTKWKETLNDNCGIPLVIKNPADVAFVKYDIVK